MKKSSKEKKVLGVSEYIANCDPISRDALSRIRHIVKSVAPEAEESISYGMPAYKTFKKPLIYFAGYDKHIGLYATPSGHSAFSDQLAAYKQGKGSVQFPLDKPIPYDLIEKIVVFRTEENRRKFGPPE